jgi:hypothetical protein
MIFVVDIYHKPAITKLQIQILRIVQLRHIDLRYSLGSPSPRGMFPIHILLLQQCGTSQLLINILALSHFVIPLHPEEQQDTETQAGTGDCQVETIADVVVGCVGRKE